MNKVTINGVEVFPFSSREQLMDYVDKNKSILIAINAEKVMNATDQTRAIINSNIGYCDGVGAVWALRQKGAKNVEKIPGCELWLDIINRYHNDKSFYLIGGKQEVIDATVKKLKQDFPGLNLVGYRNGYLKSDDERNALIDDVAQKKPDVVFVAMLFIRALVAVLMSTQDMPSVLPSGGLTIIWSLPTVFSRIPSALSVKPPSLNLQSSCCSGRSNIIIMH